MPKPKTPKCPLCGQPSMAATTPFCSQGCRDRDLLRWLDDGYRIPGPPADRGAGEREED
ncbi:DNA gyrase inhibitor YacG [Sphingomonas crocodyli]|uniref:DNA gyrase inhibitor YacG n=1 Tax=Sphingomonas crocodyli TaxID=1979270 RepID=A0A437LZV6_9SPHN|nr:DNA gyrase inhibitor YacG [Sphingomonas crocodyli]RVT90853.1 DNA gyrase inhibitor YacG [Sphingomonas crocodyli]